MDFHKFESILEGAKKYTYNNRIKDTYAFKMSETGDVTLYASVFAVMIFHYTGELDKLSDEEKQGWAEYLNSFQDPESGIYRAPEIFESEIQGGGHDEEHLSLHFLAHVLPALDLLGAQPKHPISFAHKFTNLNYLSEWLSRRNWNEAWLEGNNLLFVGQTLVYLKKNNHSGAEASLEYLMGWLDSEVDPKTGLWGTNGFCDKYKAIYGGYHQLLLYYYLKRPVCYPENLIDTTLSIQHIDGGYSRWNGGGTCQDVDAIDILVNLYKLTDYKRKEIRQSLYRGYHAVLRRVRDSGGFCDRLGHEFMHMGMELTKTPPNVANMFSTWFGIHTLCLTWEVYKNCENEDFESVNKRIRFNTSCSMGWHKKSDFREFPGASKREIISSKILVATQKLARSIYLLKSKYIKLQ